MMKVMISIFLASLMALRAIKKVNYMLWHLKIQSLYIPKANLLMDTVMNITIVKKT